MKIKLVILFKKSTQKESFLYFLSHIKASRNRRIKEKTFNILKPMDSFGIMVCGENQMK